MELWKMASGIVLRWLLYILAIFPINRERILFYPLSGHYSCNLKYIDQWLRMNHPEMDLVWVKKRGADRSYSKDMHTCKKNSFAFFFYGLTAKVVVFNSFFLHYMPKRKGQIRIDTWHGGGAYKKIAFAVSGEFENKWKRKKNESLMGRIDYVVSACEGFTRAFSKDTGIRRLNKDVIFLESGLPRNDLFFDKEKIEWAKRKICDIYSIRADNGIVIYMPTHRSGKEEQEEIDAGNLLNALKDRFGREFVLLQRSHPFVKKSIFDNAENTEKIIDVSSCPDAQELLCAADVLITDYSSCMWDFSLMGRPCFIYATDIGDYSLDRGFHTPMREWPFPLARDNEELGRNIRSFDEMSYEVGVKRHLTALGSYEDGHATEKVCRLIERICEAEEKT